MIVVDGTGTGATTQYSAHLLEVGTAHYATLATLDYEGADKIQETITATEPLQLPESWATVESVSVGGILLTPALNPESLQPGEYLYNPYTNTITTLNGGQVTITGATQQIPVTPPYLPPPHPWLLSALPLEGEISISRSFEQHPSANFTFETRYGKSFLQQALAPGLEVDLYNIPLRIESLSIKEFPRAIYPEGRCQVQISFGGRWEGYIDEPCFFRDDGRNSSGTDEPFADPDCENQVAAANKNKDQTTVQALLNKIRIPYVGPGLAPVPIPSDTPRDAVANPGQLLTERVRVANGFQFWSNPSGAEVKAIGSQQVWSYTEAEILSEVETSYDAIDKNSKRRRLLSVSGFNPPEPDLINFPSTVTMAPAVVMRSEAPTNLAFEYPNVELSGEFNQPKDDNNEKTQGQSKPRWVKKDPKITTDIEGDKKAHEPQEGVQSVRTMSLCFDIGGQTKTRTFVTKENGTRVQEISEIWGFAFTALSIYDNATKSIRGNVTECWKCLKRTTTQYFYDDNTGYLIYIIENGYNTVRFQQESTDKPETLTTTDVEKLALYDFITIPVLSQTSNLLRLMPEWDSEGLYELFKVCNRDGTSRLEPIINPNFAPPYYPEVERSESVSFASRPNPGNKNIGADSAKKRLPDIVVGEEARFQADITIIPAEYKEIYTGESVGGFSVVRRGEELQPQKFNKYNRKFKAQGQAIAEALEEVFTEENTGDPPVAQRRADLYTREEEKPQQNKATSNNENKKYKYFIQTAGYIYQDPINGSENFSVADSLEKALTAARCKLAIENWRQGLTEQLQIPGNLGIKEGDRFNYLLNGEWRQRVVLSVQHNIQVLGVIDAAPRLTIVTSLSLGRWMAPDLAWNKVNQAKPGDGQKNNVMVLDVINQTLGGLLDWSQVRSRRNP